MEKTLQQEVRLINIAGSLGTIFGRLAMAEIFLLFVTQCLDIPKETWAIVAAIVPFTSAFQIASAFLTERLQRRKLISLGCFAVSRLAIPIIMLLPFITRSTDAHLRLLFLAALVIAYNAIANLASTAWLSWVADIVPQPKRGRFYSNRFVLTTVSDIGILLLAGPLLDIASQWNLPVGEEPYRNPWGYLIVFGLAFIAGELDLIIHSRVADRPMPHRTHEPVHFWAMLLDAWRHRGFRSLMLFRMLFAVGEAVAGPFGLMYLFEELHLSATAVTTLTAGFLATNALTFGFWRRIGDRFGYRTVCKYSTFFVALGLFYWWLVPEHSPRLALAVIALGYMVHGTVWSGFSLSINTLIMNVAPPKHRSFYFAQITVMLGIVYGISIFLGRQIYLWTQPLWIDGLYFLDTKITGIHFLFGIAFFARLLSLLFLKHIPDARAEITSPELGRILKLGPLRILPALLASESPAAAYADEEPEPADLFLLDLAPEVRDTLHTVLIPTPGEQDEFRSIIQQEHLERGTGVRHLLDELPLLAATQAQTLRARAAARRIQLLFENHDPAACLRTVHRLGARLHRRAHSPKGAAAWQLIDTLARRRPADDADAILAVYACLQLAREPER